MSVQKTLEFFRRCQINILVVAVNLGPPYGRLILCKGLSSYIQTVKRIIISRLVQTIRREQSAQTMVAVHIACLAFCARHEHCCLYGDSTKEPVVKQKTDGIKKIRFQDHSFRHSYLFPCNAFRTFSQHGNRIYQLNRDCTGEEDLCI